MGNYRSSARVSSSTGNDDDYLRSCNNSTPTFSIIGTMQRARVLSVPDGNTINCVSLLDGVLHRLAVRLKGIRCPTDEIFGELSRARLIELLMGSSYRRCAYTESETTTLLLEEPTLVNLHCLAEESGVIVAEVYVVGDSISLSDLMVYAQAASECGRDSCPHPVKANQQGWR
jgi:hypothetical protein